MLHAKDKGSEIWSVARETSIVIKFNYKKLKQTGWFYFWDLGAYKDRQMAKPTALKAKSILLLMLITNICIK